MLPTRRDVLETIGASSVVLSGVTGVAGATPFGDEEDAELRVLHASPDAPAVDVFVNGDPVLEGVTFKTVSDYLPVPPGTYDVAVAPAGAGVENAVIDAELTVEADTDYTVAATNRLANIAPQVFVDDNDAGVASRRLRVVHLSPDAPAVDVVAVDGPPSLRFEEEGIELVDGITYRTASDYLHVGPWEYEFEVRPDGGDTAVFEFGAEVEVGATVTAFAVGLLGGDGEEAFDVVLSEDVPPIFERRGSSRGRRGERAEPSRGPGGR